MKRKKKKEKKTTIMAHVCACPSQPHLVEDWIADYIDQHELLKPWIDCEIGVGIGPSHIVTILSTPPHNEQHRCESYMHLLEDAANAYMSSANATGPPNVVRKIMYAIIHGILGGHQSAFIFRAYIFEPQ